MSGIVAVPLEARRPILIAEAVVEKIMPSRRFRLRLEPERHRVAGTRRRTNAIRIEHAPCRLVVDRHAVGRIKCAA